MGAEAAVWADRWVAVFGVTSALVTLLASFVAVAAFAASTSWGSAKVVGRVLAGTRRRTVALALVQEGVCTHRAARRAVDALVSDLVRGGDYDVNREMEWLASLRRDGLPFTFVAQGDERARATIVRVAGAYEHMAGRWRSRLIVGTNRNELVANAAVVAREVALALRRHASNARIPGANEDAIEVDLTARNCFAQVFYSDVNLDLAISSHPGRLEPCPGQLLDGGAQPQFDGILPHLLGHQLELDQESGRFRLHLAISEIPFSQLRARNSMAWNRDLIGEWATSHAVSLALLPVTVDGLVLFSRRSEGAGSYPGMIGPYVTGNAELRDRKGLRADRDAFGVPDLLSAVCREAFEEVGLMLKPEQIQVLGLARIWSPEDTGIWCLMTTASLTITASAAAELVRYGDPVEGTWEVGNELLAVDPWQEQDSAHAVLHWAATEPVVPQGVASLVALLRKGGSATVTDWEAANQPGAPIQAPQGIAIRQPFR